MDIKKYFSPLKWKETLEGYRRVIAVSRKPDKEEFLSTARITGLGIVIIGVTGFVIYMLYYLIA
ncbi:MAG: protein translocase SEC61 complex subunit gamma [Nanoarchaeota archaeon]|nr:protein translocase SEC61 complex subunit gamma [Nanoarchaeota archaeon]